ncbi:MAG TPA: hypothetical protein VKY74_08205, partial [Chloroflexia bacterium]|nr:hypothetical protein [Chloroflexia bacterium]
MKRSRLLAGLAALWLGLATLWGNGTGLPPAQAAPAAPGTVGCGMNFSDLPSTSPFYSYVQYLFCSRTVS